MSNLAVNNKNNNYNNLNGYSFSDMLDTMNRYFFSDLFPLTSISPYSFDKNQFSVYKETNCVYMEEKDGKIKVTFEVPGFDKDDLDISYNSKNGILHVSSKKDKKHNKKVDFVYKMVGYDAKSFNAFCKNGILSIEANKTTDDKYITKISIK